MVSNKYKIGQTVEVQTSWGQWIEGVVVRTPLKVYNCKHLVTMQMSGKNPSHYYIVSKKGTLFKRKEKEIRNSLKKNLKKK